MKLAKNTAAFAIQTADDLFRNVILPLYDDFVKDNGSSRKALLCIVFTYHLYDWRHQTNFTLKDFNKEYPGNAAIADVFELARLITNGTKHFDKPKIETRKQTGFSSAFGNAFARPLMIEIPGGGETSVDELLKTMIDFWKDQKAKGAF